MLNKSSSRPIRPLRALLVACLLTLSALTALTAAPVAAQEAAEEAPSFAPGLTDPAVPMDEFNLRLLPLTMEELGALASEWQGIVKGQTEAVVAEQLRLRAIAPGDGRGAAPRDGLIALEAERAAGFDKLTSVVESYALKGGDPAVVEGYKAYRSAIIVEETQAADWRTLLAKAADWSLDREGGVQVVLRLVVIVAAFLGLVFVARIVRRLAKRSFARIPNISKLLIAFLGGIVYWLAIAFGLLVVLSALGVNITPLFALVGGATFIIAFAMQDTLGNLASGVMIILNRPFDEGDYVTLAGVGGTVKAVSIVSTTVATPDNQVIVIPNSKVWGDIITNVTASETRRVDLVFGIGYDDSIEAAQAVLEETVAAHPLVMQDPAPVIRVHELADSSVNFICRPWVKTGDYWTTYWDLMRQVKEAFDAKGISIPYPQTDMHLRMAGPLPVAAEASAKPGEGRPAGAPDFASGDGAEGA